ncbi:Holliday junction resolvase RuvX [Mahella sp.]|uniref:Holliday junction resolvase RuvX n=1 Tax=Mahella sp. TaxID=2798721 RepID=UPI0025BD6680|nr:Holliday junction resolvase RuvX [Mahella sp.]MBZ4666312.1 Holliday junction resolvase YqgF [Mahella sp.]MDK2902881.1 putative pre6S rRNA nuclease [Clostridiales bacterium]
MRILGLDVGDNTIGIAISDELGWTAQGMETWRRKRPEDDMQHIADICQKYGVQCIVIGLPKNMNGSIGPQGKKMIVFRQRLADYMDHDIDIVLWDERLSTVAAQRSLIEADVSRVKRKKVIDKMAAVYILQGYLDSLRITKNKD